MLLASWSHLKGLHTAVMLTPAGALIAAALALFGEKAAPAEQVQGFLLPLWHSNRRRRIGSKGGQPDERPQEKGKPEVQRLPEAFSSASEAAWTEVCVAV